MKLLMIIVDTECREELEVLFKHNGVSAYTEIPNTHGVGESGVRMGSRAHPLTSSIFFTVLEPDQIGPLKEKIHAYCDASDHRMRMVQWGVEEVA
ncbi:MAG: PG0541 family transporter-associated protein [Thermoanaerobaculales bacterium]